MLARLESDGQPVGVAKLVVITFRTVILGEMILLTQSRREQNRACLMLFHFYLKPG